MKKMEIGSFDAKNKLSELLAQAERGQTIFITRRGKRVAVLGPVESMNVSPVSGGTLLDRFRKFRSQAKEGKEPIKELIDEGRK